MTSHDSIQQIIMMSHDTIRQILIMFVQSLKTFDARMTIPELLSYKNAAASASSSNYLLLINHEGLHIGRSTQTSIAPQAALDSLFSISSLGVLC